MGSPPPGRWRSGCLSAGSPSPRPLPSATPILPKKVRPLGSSVAHTAHLIRLSSASLRACRQALTPAEKPCSTCITSSLCNACLHLHLDANQD